MAPSCTELTISHAQAGVQLSIFLDFTDPSTRYRLPIPAGDKQTKTGALMGGAQRGESTRFCCFWALLGVMRRALVGSNAVGTRRATHLADVFSALTDDAAVHARVQHDVLRAERLHLGHQTLDLGRAVAHVLLVACDGRAERASENTGSGTHLERRSRPGSRRSSTEPSLARRTWRGCG